ncbi:MAG: hypothetical protein O2930_11865 [Acidobacteria bacterium]|nr:hypothetical protein [Acidobacteriota bacterium]
MAASDPAPLQHALDTLSAFGPVLSLKLYRLKLDPVPALPILPCLDHEAMLHQTVAPHAAAYVQEAASGDLHEVVFIPTDRCIEIDTVSTWGEASEESRGRLVAFLADRMPDYHVKIQRVSPWRGDRRVANACRAHVSLRDVLLGSDIDAVARHIERLKTIGSLMEKQSRVASWAVRTVTAPILAAAGVISYQVLELFTTYLGELGVTTLRYAVLTLLGIWFLYYGLKAVQLTGMSTRVWKRATEYGLILAERRRIASAATRTS